MAHLDYAHHGCPLAPWLVVKPQADGLTWSDHVVLFPELERQRVTANSAQRQRAAYSATPGNGRPRSHIDIIRPSVSRMMVTCAVTGTLLADGPVNLAFAEITGWLLRRWMGLGMPNRARGTIQRKNND
jgi:hypothetical protein